MYRIGFFLIAIIAIAFGLLVGTLNSDLVRVDLLFTELEMPLGLLLLLAFTIGLLLAVTFLYLFRILPLRMQLRRQQRVQNAENTQKTDQQQ